MKGECLCGTVAFEITDELPIPNLYQCHCSECRKACGSSATAATLVPAESFQWLKGEEKISSFTGNTGYRSDFCSVCGSPVPNPMRESGKVWVPAGLLDETDDLRVAIHLYMNSRASWEQSAGEAAAYDESPGLETLSDALRRTSR